MMGSGAGAVEETIEQLQRRGEKVGLLKVRLFRPFAVDAFLSAIPRTVSAIAVLDRTKEPGSIGEPLYLDVVAAFHESPSRSLALAADHWRPIWPFFQGIYARDGQECLRRT